jgi:heat shock protein HslJ
MTNKALLIALPFLAACAHPVATSADLTGSQWRFVSIDGAAPASDKARLEFLRDRISASAGCNGLGGAWEAKGGRLVTGPFISTMMYCDGLIEQERALGALFEAKPSYALQGDRLTLEGGGHRAELHREN